jgi:glycosyltransferase involved in cell wall biosynthesis
MIPTHNCAQYLRETLSSVLAQDPGPEHMQIEVVDDCSTKDDPESVVRELGMGRVVFHRQPGNVGHTRNFETCLHRSRGHLIHLLHGDDAVRPGFYARMAPVFAAHPEIGAAFSRNMFMDELGNWTGISRLEIPQSGFMEDLVERLGVGQRIQTPAIVVRREVYETLGGFDRRLSWTEDWEMWTRIAFNYPIWYEVEPLALYRVHGSSNTGRYRRTAENVKDMIRLYSIIKQYLPKGQGERLIKSGRSHYARRALGEAEEMVMCGEYASAIAQARAAVRLSPTPGIVWVLIRSFGKSMLHTMKRMSGNHASTPID